jgi:hypothetical protein
MSESQVPYDRDVWNDLVGHHTALHSAVQTFLSTNINRVAVLRLALQRGEIPAVLYVAQFMAEAELMQLLPEWVDLVSNAHRHIAAGREIIRTLPRAWVVAHIEGIAAPLLQQGSEDEYRRLLELYSTLDRDLTWRLIRQALQHEDQDIREAGEDFRQKMQALV